MCWMRRTTTMQQLCLWGWTEGLARAATEHQLLPVYRFRPVGASWISSTWLLISKYCGIERLAQHWMEWKRNGIMNNNLGKETWTWNRMEKNLWTWTVRDWNRPGIHSPIDPFLLADFFGVKKGEYIFTEGESKMGNVQKWQSREWFKIGISRDRFPTQFFVADDTRNLPQLVTSVFFPVVVCTKRRVEGFGRKVQGKGANKTMWKIYRTYFFATFLDP